jgi:hypothetical protein
MNVTGVQILDSIDNVSIGPSTILNALPHGEELTWSILYLDGIGDLDMDKSITELEDFIQESHCGYILDWNELTKIAKKFEQVIDIVLVGSRDRSVLHKYDNDLEMYKKCEITIIMFDSSFWEVISKNNDIVDHFAHSFQLTKPIDFHG